MEEHSGRAIDVLRPIQVEELRGRSSSRPIAVRPGIEEPQFVTGAGGSIGSCCQILALGPKTLLLWSVTNLASMGYIELVELKTTAVEIVPV